MTTVENSGRDGDTNGDGDGDGDEASSHLIYFIA